MTRVLSGAALIALAVGVVWFAPDAVFQLVAAVAASSLGVRRAASRWPRASDLHGPVVRRSLIATLLTAASAVGDGVRLRRSTWC